MQKTKQLPRGIRNNNPLNIRIGNVWLGEVDVNTDLEFEQFVSMKYGLRAAFVLLRRYINHYHLTTISEIISRWAPPSENSTVRYIDTVCQLSGIPSDLPLKFTDQDSMCKLVFAMAMVECAGHKLDMTLIESAYNLA